MADFSDPHDANAITWAIYERELHDKSPRTIQSYREAAQQLADHAKGADLLTLAKADIQAYLIHVRVLHSPSTEQVRYRSLHTFYRWCEKEEMVERSPMVGMSLPQADEKIIPVPARDDLQALLQACAGTEFEQLRDTAVIRLFADAGLRLSELAGLRLGDINLMLSQVTVRGKGAKWRQVDFSGRTAKALQRYLRARQKHELAHLDGLWLGSKKMALTPSGITQVLRRRCRQAGIAKLHPHQLRHWSAAESFSKGLTDQNGMKRYGWSSYEMVRRYGKATAERRALAQSRALAIGDDL